VKKVAAIVALVLGAQLTSAATANEPAVKKSTSGICHEKGKGSYSKTKHFEPFNSLEECVASGGRAAANAGVDNMDQGNSWLAEYGGRLLLILGGLVVAFAAYWFAARRRQASGGERLGELEQRKWEGHRLDRRDGGPKPPIS